MLSRIGAGARMFSLAAGLTVASVAVAQPAVLQVPSEATGSLSKKDPKTESGQRHDDYSLSAGAGQRLRVSAASEAFDPVLEVYAEGGEEPVARNDDISGSLNAQVTFSSKTGGTYRVRVLTFDPAGKGAYSLKAEDAEPLSPPIVATPVSTSTTQWSEYEGDLAAGDPDSGGAQFDDYQLAFKAGEELIIRAASQDFDPVVRILRAEQRDGEEIASNDDGGSGTDSLLFHKMEEAGDYVVRVTSYNTGTGKYRLRIGR